MTDLASIEERIRKISLATDEKSVIGLAEALLDFIPEVSLLLRRVEAIENRNRERDGRDRSERMQAEFTRDPESSE